VGSLQRLYNWMGSQVESRYADCILAILFYLEAIFFLPTDPMLIIFCIEKPKKAFRYATIATVSSVLGGITGYFLGLMLWNTWGQDIIHNGYVNYIISADMFTYLGKQYELYESWAILIAGFSPIPYKAATLSAGFFKLPLLPFIVFSFIGRGTRFYLYAIVVRIWGRQIKSFIDRYFNSIAMVATCLILGIIWFLKK